MRPEPRKHRKREDQRNCVPPRQRGNLRSSFIYRDTIYVKCWGARGRSREMNHPLQSWHEDSDKEVRLTCYLIAALSAASCLALVVYVMLM